MTTSIEQDASQKRVEPKTTALGASARIRALCKEEGEEDLINSLNEQERRLELGVFRLVVMGEIKKGKSSLINALLGDPAIVPTASDVATSTVFKILYGPKKRFKVFTKPDVDSGSRPEPKEIPVDEIADYGTETGNPDNLKNVDFIGVEHPSPMLKNGLVIVDTPGVGGLYRKHRDITWQYAPKADAVCFVLDSVSAVISAQEIAFLQDLVTKVTRRIFFVQTKIDSVDEEQWRSWEERNKKLLVEKLGIPESKLCYYCVSSQLKQDADESQDGFDLQQSGFVPFLDFLHRGLLETKERELAKDVARTVASAANQLRSSLSERQRIFSADSQEKLEEIKAELVISRDRLASWQRGVLQPTMQTFTERLSDLRRSMDTRLQDELDPNGLYVSNLIEECRGSEFGANELNEQAEFILQKCVDDCSTTVMAVQRDFNRCFTELLSESIDRLRSGIEADEVDSHELITDETKQSSDLTITVAKDLNLELGGGFDTLASHAFGFGIGSALAFKGTLLLSILIPPAGAVAVVAGVIGGLVGTALKNESRKKQQKSTVLDRLRAEVGRILAQAQRKATTHFRSTSEELERRAKEQIDSTVNRVQRELEARAKELHNAAKMTNKESQQVVGSVSEKCRQIDRVIAQIKPLLGTEATTTDRDALSLNRD